MKQKVEKLNIQITAGRGPAECCWVVAQVLRVLTREFKDKGFKYKVVDRSQGIEPGTLNSCLVRVEGFDVHRTLKGWEGTIQWIGNSHYRKFHKRKNWFVGVTFFKESEGVKYKEQDLVIQPYRASGPGGQHRNKVETAIRVIHQQSGVSVTASDSKSQLQNKEAALEKIKKALQEFEIDQLRKQIDNQWREHLSVERGNPVKVFEGRSFKERHNKGNYVLLH